MNNEKIFCELGWLNNGSANEEAFRLAINLLDSLPPSTDVRTRTYTETDLIKH